MEMMENLTVQDRLALLSILPGQGNITTLKIVRSLREELSFSEQEHEDYGIVMKDGKVIWEVSSNGHAKDIEIGRKAREVIVAALEDGDRRNQLEDGHIGIWVRFMEDEPD